MNGYINCDQIDIYFIILLGRMFSSN